MRATAGDQRPTFCLFLATAVFFHRLCAATPDVIVVGDITKAWSHEAQPTATVPAYYYPITGGTKESEAGTSGEGEPLRKEVIEKLAGVLAKNNYQLADKAHSPSLLLVISWGAMNPETADFSSGDPDEPPNNAFFNGREMRNLVGSYKSDEFHPMANSRLNDAAHENRFYLYVMAFDFTAARKHVKKMLWSAKMSVRSEGTTLPAALSELIVAGAPHLGHDTVPPVIVPAGSEHQEHVNLGELHVREYLPSEKKD